MIFIALIYLLIFVREYIINCLCIFIIFPKFIC